MFSYQRCMISQFYQNNLRNINKIRYCLIFVVRSGNRIFYISNTKDYWSLAQNHTVDPYASSILLHTVYSFNPEFWYWYFTVMKNNWLQNLFHYYSCMSKFPFVSALHLKHTIGRVSSIPIIYLYSNHRILKHSPFSLQH